VNVHAAAAAISFVHFSNLLPADEERGKEIGLSLTGFLPYDKSLIHLSPRVPGHIRGRLRIARRHRPLSSAAPYNIAPWSPFHPRLWPKRSARHSPFAGSSPVSRSIFQQLGNNPKQALLFFPEAA
jgi:hypothetical protein